jgi:mercuric ion transport protein
MTNQGLLRTGIIDTVIAPICCFSPILIIRLGAVGLSAMVGWLDYVLFFPLVVFAGLTI